MNGDITPETIVDAIMGFFSHHRVNEISHSDVLPHAFNKSRIYGPVSTGAMLIEHLRGVGFRSEVVSQAVYSGGTIPEVAERIHSSHYLGGSTNGI